MGRRRCSQCDKELPATWSESPNANWDPVCPECALRDLKKKSIRRRRVLDTSVRKKGSLKPAPASTPAPTPVRPPAAETREIVLRSSQRTAIPMDFELDTDDPLLLAAQGGSGQDQSQATAEAATEEAKAMPGKQKKTEKDEDVEDTSKIRKPKPPTTGPQIRLNF